MPNYDKHPCVTVPGSDRAAVQGWDAIVARLQEAIVESPEDAFAPFVVHYAETFIVPAAVGGYTIRPRGATAGREGATLKAYFRT